MFVVLPALIALVLSMMPRSCFASVVCQAELPMEYGYGSLTDFLPGGGYVGIIGDSSYPAISDYTAKAGVWDASGKLIAQSPTMSVRGMTAAVAFSENEVLCSPEVGEGKPYVWNIKTGVITVLDNLTGSIMSASDGAGNCVGRQDGKAILRKNDGTVVTLRGLVSDEAGSEVWAMNSNLQSVGLASGVDGQHGVIWDGAGNVIADLGLDFDPQDISDDGQVVGFQWTEAGDQAAVNWKNGVLAVVDDIGLYPMFTGVNNLGRIIGSVYDASGTPHAFLQDADGTRKWLDAVGTEFRPVKIGDNGVIIGSSYITDGRTAPVILTPAVPEPGSFVLALPSLMVIGALRWRRRR